MVKFYKSNTWERMSWDQLFGQIQFSPKHSDFILVEIFQRFYYFALEHTEQFSFGTPFWINTQLPTGKWLFNEKI